MEILDVRGPDSHPQAPEVRPQLGRNPDGLAGVLLEREGFRDEDVLAPGRSPAVCPIFSSGSSGENQTTSAA
jgi:hypothetical protein